MNSSSKELIYSPHAVLESLRADRRQVRRILIAAGVQEKGRIAEILLLCRARSIKVDRVPKTTLDRINPAHQGIAAEIDQYPYTDLGDILVAASSTASPAFILAIDSLQDPQNFGALLRTAEAVGVHGIVIPLAHAVAVTPAVVNASSGASEHLAISRSNLAQALDAFKSENIWIVGVDPTGQTLSEHTNHHLKGPLCLVVGSEGQGLRQLVRSKCDILMRLPMVGRIESLNAAVAGSVALYLAYFSRKL